MPADDKKYKEFNIDLSSDDWEEKIKEAFEIVSLKQTEFYQALIKQEDDKK